MRWDEIPQLISCRNPGVDWSLFRCFCDYIESEVVNGLILAPDFQQGRVWTKEQQSAYIEYLLMGGTSGRTICLNAKNIKTLSFEVQNYPDYVCVDGFQRITAIQEFYHDEIPAFGQRYSQFEGTLNATKFTMRVVINDLQSREEILQWCLELNSTGTSHSREELERLKALLDRERDWKQRNALPADRVQTCPHPVSCFKKKRNSPER